MINCSNLCSFPQESWVSCVSAGGALLISPGYPNIIGACLASCGWSRVALPWTTGLCSTCPHFLWQPTWLNSFLEAEFQESAAEMHQGSKVHCHSHHILLVTANKKSYAAQIKGRGIVSTTWWKVLHTLLNSWLQQKTRIWGHLCKESTTGVNFNLNVFISTSTFSSGMISEKTVRLNYVSTEQLRKFYFTGSVVPPKVNISSHPLPNDHHS